MTMQLNHQATIATDEHRQTLTDAVAAAHLTRRRAERELRRSQLERDQTARALELHVHPLDEQRREQLRIAYADAAASVAVHSDAFERAVELEHATEVLASAFLGAESVLVPRASVRPRLELVH